MADTRAKDKVLEAAGEVFAAKGFKAATVREICAAAGVNLASVNYYFGDKKNLYLEAIKLAHPGRPNTTDASWPPDMPVAERLRKFVENLLGRLAKENDASWKVRLFRREIIDPTPFCRETFQKYFRARFSLLAELLSEVVPPEMPEWQRRQMCFSVVGQCVYFRMAKSVISMVVGEDEYEAHYDVDELADHVMRFSLPAFGLQKPFESAGSRQAKEQKPFEGSAGEERETKVKTKP